MENFTAFNPTAIHFGKNVTDDLAKTVLLYGKKVLLIYGKSSVKKYGYYDKIVKLLKNNSIRIFEYSGIKPNPIVEDAEGAVKLAVDSNIDVIIALGGGSVIDTSKIVALAVPENLPVWDIMKGKLNPKAAVPVITILTVSATGTEMNHFSVIQNNNTQEKLGYRNPLMFPKHSFLDPQFTYSVSREYTAYGIADIIAHAFENYFGKGDSPLAEKFAASIITETMKYAPLVLEQPNNYEYRANIMLQSTCALNGTTSLGKISGDWGVHAVGHSLSLLYDTPHGASLSIAYTAWFKLFKDRLTEMISELSLLIFNTSDVDEFISKLSQFYMSINCPVFLQHIGVELSERDRILELFKKNKITGNFHKITDYDYDLLLDYMYNLKE